MKTMVDNVTVFDNAGCSEDERIGYVQMAARQTDGTLTEVTLDPEGNDQVKISYVADGEKFERIRRITGYLVGTIDRWNNAKKAEEKERVKHG